jgi:hypothetical protein
MGDFRIEPCPRRRHADARGVRRERDGQDELRRGPRGGTGGRAPTVLHPRSRRQPLGVAPPGADGRGPSVEDLSPLDSLRSRWHLRVEMLKAEERSILFTACAGHPVASCNRPRCPCAPATPRWRGGSLGDRLMGSPPGTAGLRNGRAAGLARLRERVVPSKAAVGQQLVGTPAIATVQLLDHRGQLREIAADVNHLDADDHAEPRAGRPGHPHGHAHGGSTGGMWR